MIKKIIFFSILTLFFIFPGNFSLAKIKERDIGFSVDKTVFDFQLPPNENKNFSLKIKNTKDFKQRISVEFKDVVINDQNQVELMVDENEIFGMKDWLEIEGSENLFLEPQEEKNLNFKLKIPGDAIVGSHYSLISIKALPEIDFNNFQNTIIAGEIGIYVFCNVKGDISGKGLIEKTEIPRMVDKKEELKITFRNIGNVHYIPHGGIRAKNVLTGESEDYKLDKHFVFPGKSYDFNYHWDVPSIFGIYTVQAYFVDQEGQNLSKTKLIFGKYSLLIILILSIILFFIFKEIKNKIKLFWSKKKKSSLNSPSTSSKNDLDKEEKL